MVIHLPEELLIAILSRLPIKSLLRFKCVCKNWYTLIQTPNFLDKHSQIHNQTHALVLHKVRDLSRAYYEENGLDYDPYAMSGWNSGIKDELFALLGFPDEALEFQPPLHDKIIDFIQVFPYTHGIIGPVNGLFLLKYFRDDALQISLWNPATTEFKLVHLPTFMFSSHSCSAGFGCSDFGYGCLHLFGFGLDILTDTYKVVWIPIVSPKPFDFPKAAIQTLGTCWRPIEADAFVLPLTFSLWGRFAYSCPVYLGGVIYWLIQHEYVFWIISFDFGSEVFREIHMPDRASYKCDYNLVLYNDDSIALLVTEYVSEELPVIESVEIWVMKQEDEGNWIKNFSFEVGHNERLSKPLGFLKSDNEIFFETSDNKLVLYATNTDNVRDFGVQGKCSGFTFSFSVFNYKETLVSFGGEKASKEDKKYAVVQEFFTRGKKSAMVSGCC
jgi:F-box interacting protein